MLRVTVTGGGVAGNFQRNNGGGNRPNWNRNGGLPGQRPNGEALANGNGEPQQRPGFQSAQVRQADNGEQALAQAAADAAAPDLSTEAEGALLVNGSTSGGLAQASDDAEARRERTVNNFSGWYGRTRWRRRWFWIELGAGRSAGDECAGRK